MAPFLEGSKFEGGFGVLADPSLLRIDYEVAGGATAKVHCGVYNGETVAVKSIVAESCPKHQKCISRELSALTTVAHPNIVKLVGYLQDKIECLIVMEFCGGGTVFDLLYNHDADFLTWSQQLKMSRDVADAMEHLHGGNPAIVHRDLKSLNLLLAAPVSTSFAVPEVKIADFGAAVVMPRSGEQIPRDGGDKRAASDCAFGTSNVGTLHWMAPEMMNGTSYDERVDVYSYAMVLYEILGLEVPFEDEEPGDIPSLVSKGVRPTLEAIHPNCPRSCISLMTACWDGVPAKRPTFSSICSQLSCLVSADVDGMEKQPYTKMLGDAIWEAPTADTLPDLGQLDDDDEQSEIDDESDVEEEEDDCLFADLEGTILDEKLEEPMWQRVSRYS